MKKTRNNTSDTKQRIVFEPFELDDDENNRRIERLSRKILACIDNARRDREKTNDIEAIKSNFQIA